MTSIEQSQNNPSIYFKNEQGFDNLVQFIESIPSSPQQSKEYFALALEIQRDIEPIIKAKDPKITFEGNVLSTELTESKGFNDHIAMALSSFSDPSIISFVPKNLKLLTESILFTKSEHTIKKISQIILVIFKVAKKEQVLEGTCKKAISEILRLTESFQGPFSFSAEVLLTDEAPSYNSLIGRFEHDYSVFDGITDPSDFNLLPNQGLIFKQHFEHGINEENTTTISIKLADEHIISTKKTRITKASFIDLRGDSQEYPEFVFQNQH